MMAIFGWLVCLGIVLWLTVIAGIVALNTLGKYNIGGTTNTILDKFKTWLLISFVGGSWFLLVMNSPFTIVIN